MPCSQGSKGRDHNPFTFTSWLAGGGIKGGVTHGASDEWSYKAVENVDLLLRPARHRPAPAGHRPHAPDVPPQRHRPPADRRAWACDQGDSGMTGVKYHLPEPLQAFSGLAEAVAPALRNLEAATSSTRDRRTLDGFSAIPSRLYVSNSRTTPTPSRAARSRSARRSLSLSGTPQQAARRSARFMKRGTMTGRSGARVVGGGASIAVGPDGTRHSGCSRARARRHRPQLFRTLSDRPRSDQGNTVHPTGEPQVRRACSEAAGAR